MIDKLDRGKILRLFFALDLLDSAIALPGKHETPAVRLTTIQRSVITPEQVDARKWTPK